MTDAYDGLFGMFANLPKLDGAACIGKSELFDPGTDEVTESIAVATCLNCPALAPCTAWVESLPPAQRPFGVTAAVVRREPARRQRKTA